MIAADIGGTLEAAASEVLETMFFAELSGDVPAPQEGVHVRLDFCGARSGAFHLTVSRALARSLASSFLAMEEAEVAERQPGEVVCEMANMICGSALSRLEPDAHFDLLAPALAPPAAAGEHARSYLCNGEVLALWIEFAS